jgi:hypothetical protein
MAPPIADGLALAPALPGVAANPEASPAGGAALLALLEGTGVTGAVPTGSAPLPVEGVEAAAGAPGGAAGFDVVKLSAPAPSLGSSSASSDLPPGAGAGAVTEAGALRPFASVSLIHANCASRTNRHGQVQSFFMCVSR